MSAFRCCALALTLTGALGLPLCAGDDLADKQLLYFEQHVRPLLAARCYECHSKQSKNVGGNLFLDSRAGWMQGGDLGPAIVPGDTFGSLLIRAVSYASDDLQMPPDARLREDEVSIFSRWIKMGAPDPRHAANGATHLYEIDIEEGRKFWAFQPIETADIQIPSVANKAWPRSEIDFFVLAELETRGLRPAWQADRRTLIRRATFDLLGLPPTPREVEAFVHDDAPDAYRRLVDRLLASSHYGERWGRYWLDVARYADSNGLDENIAHGNAWRYRDYVIESLNNDKPYDQFVLEQLAGDLLPKVDEERIRHQRAVATGFLSLGPKVLAEVDEAKMEMDIIDEQVETVGRAFLGLTLGCARCHDHKFDPIRTEDYYALAGIFKSTKTMEHFTKIARWHEVSIATDDQRARRQVLEDAIAARKQRIEVLEKAEVSIGDLPAGGKLPPQVERPQTDNEAHKELKERQDELARLEEARPELPTAMGVVDYETPTDLPVHIRGSHLTQGKRVPRGVPAVLEFDPAPFTVNAGQSGRLDLARWLTSRRHPLVARVMVNRIWRWHFGRGLVESTDNFGRLGKRPLNPSLLDWLATKFVDEGWSIKTMHRLIMLSRTYQMSSTYDAANAAIDRENRFQWRASVRRLEAEAIRDAILEVSGILDKTTGGSLLHVKNREFLFDHTSKDETNYDSLRRSVYLPVIRNHLYDVFQLFDYADASVMNSNRSTTTIAPQALFMMNSELIHTAANAFASRVVSSQCETDDSRLALAYMLAFGRPPTGPELARDHEYLAMFKSQAEETSSIEDSPPPMAWRLLCQALLASSEFIYVR